MKNERKPSGGNGGSDASVFPPPNAAGAVRHLPPEKDDCTLQDLGGALLHVELTLHKNTNRFGPASHARWRKKTPLEHMFHAEVHIQKHLRGDRTEPHLAHAATRLLMALQLEEESK